MKPCNPNGRFTVCWDPLDGSSIVDNNWAVGTAVGIWSKESGSGEDGLVGAVLAATRSPRSIALYGPRTTVLVGLDDGVYEFSYGCTPDGCQLPDGTFEPWICSRKQIKINPDTRIFSPANMRAGNQVEGHKQLLNFYQDEGYTLRYSGGLVPDVYQQFTKNMGIFTNPTSDKSPAKLRLAFEASPFGLLVEKAGGWQDPPTASPAAPCWTCRSTPWTSARAPVHRLRQRGRPLQQHGPRQETRRRARA